MLIDWFTVAAQVVNFLILVWLLKRFLYKPILDAIDAREQRIASALADADAKKTEAQQARDELQQKNDVFDQQRAELVSQATDEAHGERQRLLDAAKKDADTLRAERQDALKHEQQNLNAEIARRTREEVFAIARKALTDLAGESLEASMSEAFANRLQALGSDAKEEFAKSLGESSDTVLVRSAFELPEAQRTMIQTALSDTLSADVHVRFETAPDVISGIEASVHGRKFAWSISNYLESLEKRVDELFTEASEPQAELETKPEAKPEAKPEKEPDTKSKPGSATAANGQAE